MAPTVSFGFFGIDCVSKSEYEHSYGPPLLVGKHRGFFEEFFLVKNWEILSLSTQLCVKGKWLENYIVKVT